MEGHILKLNEFYWKQESTNEWILGKLISLDSFNDSGTFALVNEGNGEILPDTQCTLDISTTKLCPANPLFSTCADMTALRYLHEAALVKNLYDRWISDDRQPYTSMSNVLIAVNPLRYLKKVDKSSYITQSLDKSPPHPYHTAENAYRQLRSVKQNQSIIISGESGSGKTETSKIILDFLTDRSEPDDVNVIQSVQRKDHALGDRLMETIPILESFGNAKTHRNHNSSRFGKYMRLQFTPTEPTPSMKSSLALTGASIDTYLLETSRVVLPPTGERNFHIFYELLRSGDSKLLQDLKLVPNPYSTDPSSNIDSSISQYQYLNQSGCTTAELIDDHANFAKLKQALNYVNINQEELYRVVAGILHLGNVNFGEEDTSEGTTASVNQNDRDGAMSIAAQLLGINGNDLLDAILTKKISRMTNDRVQEKLTGRPGLQREASVYFVKKDLRQANYSRDTIAKLIYDQVFAALMRQCADALEYNSDLKDQLPYIGVLDIFGFEDFEPKNRNSFEQLLINYANEALQSMFNQCILKAEQELYQAENIWAPRNDSLMFPFGPTDLLASTMHNYKAESHRLVSYEDNKDCLALIAAKNDGMFSVIDTVGKLAGPTDRKLIEKFHSLFKKHPCFLQPHPKDMTHTFCIRHFAGVVRYRIDSFIDKNNNIISTQFEDLIQNSTLGILNSFQPNRLHDIQPRRSVPANRGSISQIFSIQMRGLTNELESTRCNFIRCIKPNAAMDGTQFDRQSVLEQLRCSGTIQACQVLQVGLPTRVMYEEIVEIYSPVLSTDFLFRFHTRDRLFVQALCHVFRFPSDSYRLGDTRLFFKTGNINLLDTILNVTPVMPPEELKQRLLKYLVRRRWLTAVTKVIVGRRLLSLYVSCKQRRQVIVLQCWMRQTLAKRHVASLRKQSRISSLWTQMTRKLHVQAAFEGAVDDKLALLQALLAKRNMTPGNKWLLTWLGPLQRSMYVQKLGKSACITYLAKNAFLALLDKIRRQRACIRIQSQIRRFIAIKHVECVRKKQHAVKLWHCVRIRVKAVIWFIAMFRRAHVLNLERDNENFKLENERLRTENERLKLKKQSEPTDQVAQLESQIQLLQQQLQEALRSGDTRGNDAHCPLSSIETSSTTSSDWIHGSHSDPSNEELTLMKSQSDDFIYTRQFSRGSTISKHRNVDSDITSLMQREVEQQRALTKRIRSLVRDYKWPEHP